ncbi:MAG TPA: glycosyltransferase family A protein [Leptolyngbyaceae cyanobacterium]
MSEKITLSIVTATRGNFSEYWLEQLLKIKGDVQLILVYPPDANFKYINDSRIKNFKSPYRGEVMQRTIGLLNASGKYVLALDDDDFVHPDVLEFTVKYFNKFPESWVLRLRMKKILFSDEEEIKKDWAEITDVNQLEVLKKTKENPDPFKGGKNPGLLELPIAPVDNKFDVRYAIWPGLERKDMHGIHIENFNNKIWKNQLVQDALTELGKAMKIFGAITWVPSWNLDRLLGLFIQAKFFQKDAIIGHWMPIPEQIRFIIRPDNLKETRIYLEGDILLAKRFPQYGYFWNLFFSQLYDVPRVLGKSLKRHILKQ